MVFKVSIGLAAAFIACFPAAAQSSSSDGACELHIWPGAGLNSVYSGVFHGGIVNGAVTGRDGYPTLAVEPIDTANQVELLRSAALRDQLNLAKYQPIVHEEALSSRLMRTSVARIAPSSAPCYAEFIVDSVFFQQDIVDGSYLKILFRYRDFTTEPAPRRVFSTWTKTRLTLLPPTPTTDMVAAGAELRAAFTRDVALFASALAKPSKTKASH